MKNILNVDIAYVHGTRFAVVKLPDEKLIVVVDSLLDYKVREISGIILGEGELHFENNSFCFNCDYSAKINGKSLGLVAVELFKTNSKEFLDEGSLLDQDWVIEDLPLKKYKAYYNNSFGDWAEV
jgi:hypothetical protein